MACQLKLPLANIYVTKVAYVSTSIYISERCKKSYISQRCKPSMWESVKNVPAKKFRRRAVRRTNKINEDGGPINPKKGDQRVLKDGGQRWDGNKFLLPPRRWQLMLRCRAEGEAAKGLVTCQTPHVPEFLTTR